MKIPPLHTLIADDSEDDRFLISRAVRAAPGASLVGVTTDGVDTIAYLNGFAAYANRAAFPYPDLVLLDYQMPGYDGLEVLAWLRQQPRRPKVILWSHTVEMLNEVLAYELGADLVCAKPGIAEHVYSILSRFISASRVQCAQHQMDRCSRVRSAALK